MTGIGEASETRMTRSLGQMLRDSQETGRTSVRCYLPTKRAHHQLVGDKHPYATRGVASANGVSLFLYLMPMQRPLQQHMPSLGRLW